MNYRILPSEEWHKLSELIEPEFLPTPLSATAAVAEDDAGQVLGVLFLQLVLHMEPLLIRSREVNFMRLAQTLHTAVSDQKGLVYYAFTDDPQIARMAELVGMERTSYQIWKKEVE